MSISYNKLWKMLIDKGTNKTKLRKATHISSSTLANLSSNQAVALPVLEKICAELECEIAGKKVFDVAERVLIACFDKDVTDETVKVIAQKKPYYAVFRDSIMANDSVATNFEQIFETCSPNTVRKVL